MAPMIEDLSLLTGVNEKTLKKFIPLIKYIISHNVYENICIGKEITEIDIGIGTLVLKNDGDSIKYRFVPCKDLDKLILETVTLNKSPIVTKLEENFQERLEKSYKELL